MSLCHPLEIQLWALRFRERRAQLLFDSGLGALGGWVVVLVFVVSEASVAAVIPKLITLV